jgi:hypothetical protein
MYDLAATLRLSNLPLPTAKHCVPMRPPMRSGVRNAQDKYHGFMCAGVCSWTRTFHVWRVSCGAFQSVPGGATTDRIRRRIVTSKRFTSCLHLFLWADPRIAAGEMTASKKPRRSRYLKGKKRAKYPRVRKGWLRNNLQMMIQIGSVSSQNVDWRYASQPFVTNIKIDNIRGSSTNCHKFVWGWRLERRKVDRLERRKVDRLERRKVTPTETYEIHSDRVTDIHRGIDT